MTGTIRKVNAQKILDSRGNATIEVRVYTKDVVASACAPSGASVGRFEVRAFPEGGVDASIEMVNKISSKLKGLNVEEQNVVDSVIHEFDGTKQFEKLGGNAAIATSIAVAKAAALEKNVRLCEHIADGRLRLRLPFPLSNIIGGGVHTKGDSIDFQEFLVVPLGAKKFRDAAVANVMVHKEVARILTSQRPHYVFGRNDEGAWAAPLTIKEALEVLSNAAQKVEGELGIEVKIGVDAAASELWIENEKVYVYRKEKCKKSTSQQLDYVLSLIEEYDIFYFEDPFGEEDFEAFAKLNKNVSGRCLVTGDDLTVTNKERLKTALERGSVSSIIVKPNQVGTLTDVKETVTLALSNNVVPVASHRSGETCDSALAHIAVGLKCPIIKIGIMGSERMAKINELIRLEDEMGLRMAKPPFSDS